jgi:hypothetical protein
VRAADAYIRLLRRLLFDDVGIPARRREVPIWLWPGAVGRSAAFLLGLLNYARVDLRSRAILLRRRIRDGRR